MQLNQHLHRRVDQMFTVQALMAISNGVCRDDVVLPLLRAASINCEASASLATCGVIAKACALISHCAGPESHNRLRQPGSSSAGRTRSVNPI